MELDHWDDDPLNNDPSNAVTLCFACHNVKTEYVRLDPEKGHKKFVKWVVTVTDENGKLWLRQVQEQRNKSGLGRFAWSRNRNN